MEGCHEAAGGFIYETRGHWDFGAVRALSLARSCALALYLVLSFSFLYNSLSISPYLTHTLSLSPCTLSHYLALSFSPPLSVYLYLSLPLSSSSLPLAVSLARSPFLSSSVVCVSFPRALSPCSRLTVSFAPIVPHSFWQTENGSHHCCRGYRGTSLIKRG